MYFVCLAYTSRICTGINVLLPVHFLLVPVAAPVDFLTVEQITLTKKDYLNNTESDYLFIYIYVCVLCFFLFHSLLEELRDEACFVT